MFSCPPPTWSPAHRGGEAPSPILLGAAWECFIRPQLPSLGATSPAGSLRTPIPGSCLASEPPQPCYRFQPTSAGQPRGDEPRGEAAVTREGAHGAGRAGRHIPASALNLLAERSREEPNELPKRCYLCNLRPLTYHCGTCSAPAWVTARVPTACAPRPFHGVPPAFWGWRCDKSLSCAVGIRLAVMEAFRSQNNLLQRQKPGEFC